MASPPGSAPEIPPVPPASSLPPSTDSPPPAPQPDVPAAPPTSSSTPPVPASPSPIAIQIPFPPPPSQEPPPNSAPTDSSPPAAAPPTITSPPPSPSEAPPPSSQPGESPSPTSTVPISISPPPPLPSHASPPASPTEASPPSPSAPSSDSPPSPSAPSPDSPSSPSAPSSDSPASPSMPTPSPPMVLPSPSPAASTPSSTTPPPSSAVPVGITPPASHPPANPPPPSHSLPASPNSPVISSPPTPSKPARATPTKHSPAPPPRSGLPSPPGFRIPDAPPPPLLPRNESPTTSPPSSNRTQTVTPASPQPISRSLPPSPLISPPSNPTPSSSLPPPVSNKSLPGAPTIPTSTEGASTGISNSSPGNSLRDSSSSEGGGIKTGTAVGIAVVVSVVMLGLMGIVLWFVNKRKKGEGGFAGGHVMPSPFNSSRRSEFSEPRSPTPLVKIDSSNQGFLPSPLDPGLGHSRPWFTFKELSDITDGFSKRNLLGEGGFGCVYKGCLPDGREVAIKQLKVDGGQGEREFRAEVEIISRVHHRHLVSLVGYCISENQKLLIYDFVPNSTLHCHLHEGRPVMPWATRLKVASGAARGLAYLHEDCHPRIIHRDIKSSNILLDNNFEARVSDFGLAKLAADANTHVTTRVVGTFGYLAPEYASSGKLTSKSDVFSFGVVLLELVTGRKSVDPSQPVGDESLVEWARPLMTRALETGEFEELPDPRLEKNYNATEMFRMIEVAASCVRHSAAMRPQMGQVVRALDGLGVSTDLQNGMTPGQSELFDSAQESEEIRLFQRMAFGNQDYSSDFSHFSWSKIL